MASWERDPYEVLGLSADATPDAIRKRYKELVAQYHPDRHENNPLGHLAKDKLREINWAYEVVTGKASRASPSAPPARTPAPKGDLVKGLRWLVIIVTLGLALLRAGSFLARELIAALEGILGSARGTPVGVVVVILLLGWALARVIRARRRS